MAEKEDIEDVDKFIENARMELEVRYRELKEEIKKMKNNNLYNKNLVSIFECEPR